MMPDSDGPVKGTRLATVYRVGPSYRNTGILCLATGTEQKQHDYSSDNVKPRDVTDKAIVVWFVVHIWHVIDAV